jgi:hypothetical protein
MHGPAASANKIKLIVRFGVIFMFRSGWEEIENPL